MKINVKDATIDKILNIIKERKKQCDRGENATMFEMAQMHELKMLQYTIEKEFNYGK